MHTDTKNEQQYIKMTTTPVGRLISSLAIPTIISMLVTAVYNMADTYFVSQIGTSAARCRGHRILPDGPDPGSRLCPGHGRGQQHFPAAGPEE